MKNRKIKVDGRARPLRAPEEPASEDPPSKPTCTIAPGELKQPRRESPQETVNKFWRQMSSKHPGKLFTILPGNQHARSGAAKTLPNTDSCHWVARSYEVARAECEKKVTRIIKECRRVYQKYRDWEFDVEDDLKNHTRDCLDGLEGPAIDLQPMGIRRVADIFENPQFFIKEPRADGIRQGDIGNCYLMAALCSMGNVEGLIDKICVMHDEACQAVGVYGFVFFRGNIVPQTKLFPCLLSGQMGSGSTPSLMIGFIPVHPTTTRQRNNNFVPGTRLSASTAHVNIEKHISQVQRHSTLHNVMTRTRRGCRYLKRLMQKRMGTTPRSTGVSLVKHLWT